MYLFFKVSLWIQFIQSRNQRESVYLVLIGVKVKVSEDSNVFPKTTECTFNSELHMIYSRNS